MLSPQNWYSLILALQNQQKQYILVSFTCQEEKLVYPYSPDFTFRKSILFRSIKYHKKGSIALNDYYFVASLSAFTTS